MQMRCVSVSGAGEGGNKLNFLTDFAERERFLCGKFVTLPRRESSFFFLCSRFRNGDQGYALCTQPGADRGPRRGKHGVHLRPGRRSRLHLHRHFWFSPRSEWEKLTFTWFWLQHNKCAIKSQGRLLLISFFH